MGTPKFDFSFGFGRQVHIRSSAFYRTQAFYTMVVVMSKEEICNFEKKCATIPMALEESPMCQTIVNVFRGEDVDLSFINGLSLNGRTLKLLAMAVTFIDGLGYTDVSKQLAYYTDVFKGKVDKAGISYQREIVSNALAPFANVLNGDNLLRENVVHVRKIADLERQIAHLERAPRDLDRLELIELAVAAKQELLVKRPPCKPDSTRSLSDDEQDTYVGRCRRLRVKLEFIGDTTAGTKNVLLKLENQVGTRDRQWLLDLYDGLSYVIHKSWDLTGDFQWLKEATAYADYVLVGVTEPTVPEAASRATRPPFGRK